MNLEAVQRASLKALPPVRQVQPQPLSLSVIGPNNDHVGPAGGTRISLHSSADGNVVRYDCTGKNKLKTLKLFPHFEDFIVQLDFHRQEDEKKRSDDSVNVSYSGVQFLPLSSFCSFCSYCCQHSSVSEPCSFCCLGSL